MLTVLNAMASVAALVGVVIQFTQLRRERTARISATAAATPPTREMSPAWPTPSHTPTQARQAPAPSPRRSPLNRTPATATGLIICILLGASGLVGLLALVGAEGAPPLDIMIVVAVLGLITVVAAIPAWRGSRRGLLVVIISRVVDVLLGMPAYFVDEAPTWAPVTQTISIAATLVCVGLLSFALRRPSLAMTG